MFHIKGIRKTNGNRGGRIFWCCALPDYALGEKLRRARGIDKKMWWYKIHKRTGNRNAKLKPKVIEVISKPWCGQDAVYGDEGSSLLTFSNCGVSQCLRMYDSLAMSTHSFINFCFLYSPLNSSEDDRQDLRWRVALLCIKYNFSTGSRSFS